MLRNLGNIHIFKYYIHFFPLLSSLYLPYICNIKKNIQKDMFISWKISQNILSKAL